MNAVFVLGSPRENGSTAAIISEIAGVFAGCSIETKIVCLGNCDIKFCVGCMKCQETGECVHNDDMTAIIDDIRRADIVAIASPSYWGDVTAQMKQFIDRCTPYGNTNADRTPIPAGKHGVAIAVRAGQNKKENENLLSTIEHFLGHLDIPLEFSFTVEGISTLDDLMNRPSELERARQFGLEIMQNMKNHL